MSSASVDLGRGRSLFLPIVTSIVFVAGTFAVAIGAGPRLAAVALTGVVWLTILHRRLLAWPGLLTGLLLVILFIPIGRYSLPGGLPFDLEPYRIFVALLFGLWFSSLLIDPRVRLRGTALAAPMVAVLFTAVISVVANPARIHRYDLSQAVVKRVTFLASFVIVFFLIVSVVRTARDVDHLVRKVVVGSSVLAGFALVEYSTGHNFFGDLGRVLPLHEQPVPISLTTGGDRLRVFASAEHPIALGALFVMVLPLCAYLWKSTNQKRWWFAAGLLLLGNVATQSRTAIVMLIVEALLLLALRPRAMARLWPALVPAILAVHLVLPGSLGSLKDAFLPKGGLIAQQGAGAGSYGSGRIADIGPSLTEYSQRPFFGEGLATRVTERGPKQNAPILDDQWLTTLLEVGAVGALAWLWAFSRLIRRLSRQAREDRTARGWLCAGLAASVLSFAVGMLTYDAYSFIQVTIMLFVLLAMGSALLAIPREQWHREMAET